MQDGLKIYFIHSLKIDFNNLIYLPLLRNEELAKHKLIFSQSSENIDKYFKDTMSSAGLIVVLLTNPDIGFNMELKSAIMSKKPILALAQRSAGYDQKYDKLLKNIVFYETDEELCSEVIKFIKENEKKVAKGNDSSIILGVLDENTDDNLTNI